MLYSNNVLQCHDMSIIPGGYRKFFDENGFLISDQDRIAAEKLADTIELPMAPEPPPKTSAKKKGAK